MRTLTIALLLWAAVLKNNEMTRVVTPLVYRTPVTGSVPGFYVDGP